MVDDPVHTDPENDPVFQYLTGQRNASQPALLAAFEQESVAALQALRPTAILPTVRIRGNASIFSARPARSDDRLFPCRLLAVSRQGTVSFPRAAARGAGFDLAVVNYPLCPDVTLEELTQRRATPFRRCTRLYRSGEKSRGASSPPDIRRAGILRSSWL